MNLSNFIAKRYLFAKKSHNVINIISIISAAGIAIGCAALVIILSVYNGFDSIVRSLYNSYTPDLLITPAEGKVFSPEGDVFDSVRKDKDVLSFCEVLEENVFLMYGERSTVATAKGVDSTYEEASKLKDYLIEGEFDLKYGTMNQVVIGRTLALELGLRATFLTPLEVYFPSRSTEISLLNPMESLHKERLYPSGVISLEQNFDKKYIFMPIEALEDLLEYDGQVSSVEIYLQPNALSRKGLATKNFQRKIAKMLGDKYVVKNKQEQNEQVYKLLSYEKIAIYAILLFVMVIISCNIFSSLSMLIIEKKDDIGTLRSLGAEDSLIKKVFVTEGWLISLCGIVAGILTGIVVCVLQQKLGIVKMPGNFIITDYPVKMQLSDILIIILGVGMIGYCTAIITKVLNYTK
ncbi:MAG: FtsX-like permease family protein [Bacteroidales bacterium]|nr:FtsX-like permease family protein [Bacteroidales bacterium]MDD3200570.1 FtsX-like permease family protein [Bacteroidales bacterium]